MPANRGVHMDVMGNCNGETPALQSARAETPADRRTAKNDLVRAYCVTIRGRSEGQGPEGIVVGVGRGIRPPDEPLARGEAVLRKVGVAVAIVVVRNRQIAQRERADLRAASSVVLQMGSTRRSPFVASCADCTVRDTFRREPGRAI